MKNLFRILLVMSLYSTSYLCQAAQGVLSAEGTSDIFDAIKNNNLHAVKYWVDQGANLESYDQEGKTPLTAAIMAGDLDIVKYLVTPNGNIKGANIEAKDQYMGATPLGYAIILGTLDILNYLAGIEGIHINDSEQKHITKRRMEAVLKSSTTAQVELTSQDTNDIFDAIKKRNLNAVKYWVDQGINLDMRDQSGVTPLIVAAWLGQLDIVKYLLAPGSKVKGADINAGDNYGYTPLIWAVLMDKMDVVKYLVAPEETIQGADVNIRSHSGKTALETAIEKGKVGIVNYLTGIKGINISHSDKKKITKMKIAASQSKLKPSRVAQAEEEDVKGAMVQEIEQGILELLTIFLDNSEVMPQSSGHPVTGGFLTALMNKAGGVVASSSLLYSVMEGSYAQKYPEMVDIFKTQFNNGEDWIIKEVSEYLLVMVPKGSDKIARALKLDDMTDTTVDQIVERYRKLSPYDFIIFDYRTGPDFIEILKNNRLFGPKDNSPELVVYLTGHGQYQKSIASVSLNDFPYMLDSFEKKANVYIFAYDSCYAAGSNAIQVYGELTKVGAIKVYPFRIITQASTDATTVTTQVRVDLAKELVFSQHFDQFIRTLRNDRRDYREAVAYIMDASIGLGRNSPQERPPHSPAFFPIDEDIVRITETMALTREQPLIITKEINRVFLNTAYIPFEIIVEKDAEPLFIITTSSSDTAVYIEKMTIKGTAALRVEDIFNLNFEKRFYKDSKQIYIAELVLLPTVNELITRKDVVLDFGHLTMYFTNANNQQFSSGSQGINPVIDDYRLLFAGIMGSKEQQQKRWIELKKLQKTLDPSRIKGQFVDISAEEKHLSEINEPWQLLKNTFDERIKKILVNAKRYREVFKPELDELQSFLDQQKITQEQVLRVNVIQEEINSFLALSDEIKKLFVDSLSEAQSVLAQINTISGFPEEEKKVIQDQIAYFETIRKMYPSGAGMSEALNGVRLLSGIALERGKEKARTGYHQNIQENPAYRQNIKRLKKEIVELEEEEKKSVKKRLVTPEDKRISAQRVRTLTNKRRELRRQEDALRALERRKKVKKVRNPIRAKIA